MTSFNFRRFGRTLAYILLAAMLLGACLLLPRDAQPPTPAVSVAPVAAPAAASTHCWSLVDGCR